MTSFLFVAASRTASFSTEQRTIGKPLRGNLNSSVSFSMSQKRMDLALDDARSLPESPSLTSQTGSRWSRT